MSRAACFLAVVCLVSLAGSKGAKADVVVDQQYSFTSSRASSTNGADSEMGQTFTAGIAGVLDHIDVFMFRIGSIFDPTGDPVLRVYQLSSGLPTGSPLATVTVPESNVPLNAASFVSFDVSSAGINLAVGTQLGFSVTAASGIGPYFLPTDQDLPIEYTGGAAIQNLGGAGWTFISPNQDHSFRTFVAAVPEASAGWLLLLAFSTTAVGLLLKNGIGRHRTAG